MSTSCFHLFFQLSTIHTTARMSSSDDESGDNQIDLVDVEQHTDRVLGRKGLVAVPGCRSHCQPAPE